MVKIEPRLCTCVGTCNKTWPMPKGVACRLDKGTTGRVMGKCEHSGKLKDDGTRRCNAPAPRRELVGQLITGRAFLCDAHAVNVARQGITVRTILEDELPLT